MIEIAINGVGRIGRLVFRTICDQGLLGKEIDIVAANDLVPADIQMTNRFFKPVSWDNEWGYRERFVDLTRYIASKEIGHV